MWWGGRKVEEQGMLRVGQGWRKGGRGDGGGDARGGW